jgi:hypothetical protein
MYCRKNFPNVYYLYIFGLQLPRHPHESLVIHNKVQCGGTHEKFVWAMDERCIGILFHRSSERAPTPW